tara:strand:+ start:1067 stop:1210 length:144 start_codon:yes stop_codon:yes gene_type:complete
MLLLVEEKSVNLMKKINKINNLYFKQVVNKKKIVVDNLLIFCFINIA